MLHILLIILKWIGIAFLSILGVLVLLILLVLFVPIRYRVKGCYDKTPDVKVTVSWLFHLIHAKVRYREEMFFQVRVLGIPFMDSRKTKKTKKPKKIKAQDTGEREETEPDQVIQNQTEQEPKYETEDFGEQDKECTEKFDEQGIEPTEVCADTEPGVDGRTTKKSVFAKIKSFFSSIFRLLSNIRYTIRNVCGKIKNVRDVIAYYHSVLTGEEGRQALDMIKTELGKLFRHIAPRKFSLDVTFGFDDPATTGQVMAILSMLYPIYGYNISLNPVFDQAIIKGNIHIKGRIRVFTLLRIAWRVYFNKNLKKVLKMLQKEV